MDLKIKSVINFWGEGLGGLIYIFVGNLLVNDFKCE